MCQFCRPLENLLQRDRHPALLRPFLPLLTKFHNKSKPLLGKCYRRPLLAAIKFHRAWDASGLFPDKLKRFEEEIEKLQREVEDHEEVLVDLQGYGSGIGSWGSVGGGKSKDSSRGSRRGRKTYVDDGDDDAADGEHSRSNSQRSDDEEEEEEKKESGQAGGRNGPARGAATASRPKAARADEAYHPGQVSRRMIPLSSGPESPKTTKEKPRFCFRRGLKAYINEFLDYKVDELVEDKVEKRLALERSQEPSSGPASGLVSSTIKFVEDVDAVGFSVPGPMKPWPKKVVNKRPVPEVAQPERPRASKGRPSSRHRLIPMAHVPALYRVGGSSRRRTRSPPAVKSWVPEVAVDEPELGNPDAEERGGIVEEWVDDDVEDPEQTTHPAKTQPQHISWDIPREPSDADSMAPNDGLSDADDDVHKDTGSVAPVRDFGPAPDAAASNALHATVEEAESSDDAGVDPEKLVRDLWPRLGPSRRPLTVNKRHRFVDVRTV